MCRCYQTGAISIHSVHIPMKEQDFYLFFMDILFVLKVKFIFVHFLICQIEESKGCLNIYLKVLNLFSLLKHLLIVMGA